MRETWKDVVGYEGLYKVSSLGRVWSNKTNRILKQAYTRGGYLKINLCKNGIISQFRVNRLVAINFIPNLNNLPDVGHDDDNKENNSVENLYWTNAKENSVHNNRHLRIGKKVSKAIIGISNNKTITFQSSLEAGKNGFNASAVRNCLTGRAKTHKGFVWEYAS